MTCIYGCGLPSQTTNGACGAPGCLDRVQERVRRIQQDPPKCALHGNLLSDCIVCRERGVPALDLANNEIGRLGEELLKARRSLATEQAHADKLYIWINIHGMHTKTCLTQISSKYGCSGDCNLDAIREAHIAHRKNQIEP